MAESMWYADLESRLFTVFKTLCNDTLEQIGGYTANYGMVGQENTNVTLPYFYFHELPSPEQGGDLMGDEIHAVFENVEVRVTVNTNKHDCKKLSAVATSALKQMRFNISTIADLGQSGNLFNSVIRARRMFGSEDTIFAVQSNSLLYPQNSLEPDSELYPETT